MSAKARGIIVSGDVGKLIVEASDVEVDRFGRGDLVEIGLLQRRNSNDPFAAHWYYGGMPWPNFSEPSGNAKLVTRCGCEKWVQVPTPIPRTFRVSMHESMALTATLAAIAGQVACRIRNFELKRADYDDRGRRYHVYEEAW